MKKNILPSIVCTYCKGQLALKEFNRTTKTEISYAVLSCSKCGAWFPIEDGIANFLPEHLSNRTKREEFARKWEIKETTRSSRIDQSSESEKRKQIDFFNADTEEYDENMESTPFWKANDWNCLKNWLPKTSSEELILDLGCGTGRASLPFAKQGSTVIGLDISEEMVKKARDKSFAQGLQEHTDYLVGDAENPPFTSRSFNVVIAFGVLHHVPKPQDVLKEISRLMKPGGYYFGHENNQTILRPLFDLTMKISKLWDEEAGNHPLISTKNLKKWSKEANMKVNYKTSVFLPPHLFNLVGESNAKKLISISDSIAQLIPFLKDQGGVLIIEGRN